MNNEVESWEELDETGRDWLAERYVLLDPTLDREAFERQMAEQLDVALAVAAAVARYERLSAATCQLATCPAVVAVEPVAASGQLAATGQIAVSGSTAAVVTRSGWSVWYACGLAIALGSVMIGGRWWRWSTLADATPAMLAVAQGEGDLTQVAERWLALAPPDDNEKDANEKDASERNASESSWNPLEPSPAESLSAVEVVEDGTSEWSLQTEQLAAAEEPDWMLEVAAAFFDEAGG